MSIEQVIDGVGRGHLATTKGAADFVKWLTSVDLSAKYGGDYELRDFAESGETETPAMVAEQLAFLSKSHPSESDGVMDVARAVYRGLSAADFYYAISDGQSGMSSDEEDGDQQLSDPAETLRLADELERELASPFKKFLRKVLRR